MTRRTKSSAAISLLLIGCPLDRREELRPNFYTPMGYGVIAPNSWSRDPFTSEQTLGWVDARIGQWINQRKDGYGIDYVTAVSYGCLYELIDDVKFWTGTSGFANGQWFGADKRVKACLYAKAQSTEYPASVPYGDMGPWLLDGLWKWGVFPSDGIGFAVIPHELDHAIGIDH